MSTPSNQVESISRDEPVMILLSWSLTTVWKDGYVDFTADVHRNDDIVTAHNEADGTCTIFEFQEGEIRWSRYKEHRNGDFRSVKGTE